MPRALDGALRSDDGDYVMVVDTSMGFNKVSTVMQQAMQYTVTLSNRPRPASRVNDRVHEHQSARAGLRSSTARLRSEHDLRTVGAAMLLAVSARAGSAGRGVDRCLAPSHRAGRTRSAVSTSDGATRVSEEDGKTVFGTFLIVPRGQRVESQLELYAARFSRADAGRSIECIIWCGRNNRERPRGRQQ